MYIEDIIEKEHYRQNNEICLIASENYVSERVRKIQGSILTNKYAEGYPGKRYYGGCVHIDEIERHAIGLACYLFNSGHANVQPHSGSQANASVYQALLKEGDTVLGMSLDQGGHLTHGHKANISGKRYNFISYGLDENGVIDIKDVEHKASLHKPKLIILGFSAYSGDISYLLPEFRRIADSIGAYFMVDMAHIAGIVAAKLCVNPVTYADVVTSTTHKTLRGPRGGLILWNDDKLTSKINSSVFPGNQGGPLMHVIAAKAACFEEACSKDFKGYIGQVLLNADAMANKFIEEGFKVVSDGTFNHMFLLDTSSIGMTGAAAEALLESAGIIVNKNMLPNDKESPTVTSGIRIGTPAITTRGAKRADCIELARIISMYLKGHMGISRVKENINDFVKQLSVVE